MVLPLCLKVAVVIVALIIGYVSYYYGPFKGQANNPIEEIAEEVIKEESGIQIELPGDAQKQDDTNAKS